MKFKFLNIILAFLVLLSFSVPAFAETEKDPSFNSVEENGKVEYISGYTAEYEALSSQEKQKIRDAEAQWYSDHTYNVTVTAIYSLTSADSNTDNLQIETIYTSNDPKFIKEFGLSEVSSIQSIQIEAAQKEYNINEKSISAEKLKSEKIIISENQQIIMAAASDPFKWWEYGWEYPPHMWKKDALGGYAGNYTIREDPTNLIWNNTTAANARATLVSQAGWVNLSTSNEYPYAVYDQNGSWVLSQSVANNSLRINGGYHVRIFQLSDGSVVGGAHEDSAMYYSYGVQSHKVVEFEAVELLVGTYFSQAGWAVQNNSIYLTNGGFYGVNQVYNSGFATVITR